ncbi:MAG: pitrilysin family protein [Polyangiaceae bacterium]
MVFALSRWSPPACLVAGALLLSAAPARAETPTKTETALKIPHAIHRLDNGLTLIFHEDHSQPLVVVNLNVNVGSRDEPAKRTGFAHLFEHLMFMGTAKVPEKKFDAWMEAEGGWNNAWTSNDRTDYYDVSPSHALPLLLWMEADRFSTLGSQIDQSKLDTQRGVVQNERRQQVENTPYGKAELDLPGLLFPEGHPYHHPVIGSHEDLEAASVEDVRSFFADYYVAPNLSLVVAGDFDPEATRAQVEQYFGSLPKVEAKPRPTPASPAKLSEVVRHELTDNVTLPKLTMAWLSPALYAPGDAELDLLSAILSDGKVSRLYKKLVYDRKIAQSVQAYQSSKAVRSNFAIEVVASPGVSLADLEKAVDEEIDRLRKEPVSDEELSRARNQYEAAFIRRMESLATRASLLNGYFASRGEPDWAAADLQRYLDATPASLQRIASQILDPGQRVIMHILPKPDAEAP